AARDQQGDLRCLKGAPALRLRKWRVSSIGRQTSSPVTRSSGASERLFRTNSTLSIALALALAPCECAHASLRHHPPPSHLLSAGPRPVRGRAVSLHNGEMGRPPDPREGRTMSER